MCFRGHLSPHGFWRSACTRSAGQQSPRPNSSLGRRGAGSGTTASSGRSRHGTWTSVVLDFKPHRTHLRRLSSGRRKARRMSVPAANLLSPADWYRTIRDQIQHEDNLIVQRLSWLMAANRSFLPDTPSSPTPHRRLAVPCWPNSKTCSLILFQQWRVFPISSFFAVSSPESWRSVVCVELTPRTSMQWVVFRRFTQAGSYGRWEWALRFFSPWFF